MQGLLLCAHTEGLLETVGSGAVARTLGLGVFVNTLRAQTRVGFPLVCVDVGVGGVGARWARRGRGVGAAWARRGRGPVRLSRVEDVVSELREDLELTGGSLGHRDDEEAARRLGILRARGPHLKRMQLHSNAKRRFCWVLQACRVEAGKRVASTASIGNRGGPCVGLARIRPRTPRPSSVPLLLPESLRAAGVNPAQAARSGEAAGSQRKPAKSCLDRRLRAGDQQPAQPIYPPLCRCTRLTSRAGAVPLAPSSSRHPQPSACGVPSWSQTPPTLRLPEHAQDQPIKAASALAWLLHLHRC